MGDLFLSQTQFENIFKSHLKIETYSKSIENLFSQRMLNRINYSPYYQRNYVWDINKASYFIESIMLGTEIPPIILFNDGIMFEVIDGRQRFESIKRFMENDYPLAKNGLSVLYSLNKLNFDAMARQSKELIDLFLDAKIRIIEFAIVNEPPMDPYLRDKVKKEIFSRYNSGITPLKKDEIENAIFDSDVITTYFKNNLKTNQKLTELIFNLFIPQKNTQGKIPLESLLGFIRKFLVLHYYPIKYFANGGERRNTLRKLYEYFTNTNNDFEAIYKSFIEKVMLVRDINNTVKQRGLFHNRLLNECILWVLNILEKEGIAARELLKEDKLEVILNEFNSNSAKFTIEDSNFRASVLQRFSLTTELVGRAFDLDLSIYIGKYDDFLDIVKKVGNIDTNTKLSELESLRITKPDPSRNSIDDLQRNMNRRRFLVRPSYQRNEVINITKASSIIESILLDITLPPIFVFKREDGVSEVIDGQQRILAILGFIGSHYIDEDKKQRYANINNFALKNLKILKDLNGSRFNNLTSEQQNKILDFELFIVEIEERLNKNFDPVDLFIRLNNKPYPIRENSFEMWNSWVDMLVIKHLKEIAAKRKEWFYVRKLNKPTDRDRMLTEELITTIAYYFYKSSQGQNPHEFIDIYAKSYRIMARVREKRDITNTLTQISMNENENQNFFNAIKCTDRFISKLQIILLSCNKTKDELFYYLSQELDEILKGGKKIRYFKRSFQDFYILWYLLYDLNYEIVKYFRLDIKKEIKDIFIHLKNLNGKEDDLEKFLNMVKEFKNSLKLDERTIVLNESEKLEMIKKQNNSSGISNAPIFLGDDIEIDHKIPIAKGGQDILENLQIVHKDENRKKGTKL